MADGTVEQERATTTSGAQLRWFSLAAMTASLAASGLLVDVPVGINVPIVGALVGASVLLVARHRLERVDWMFGSIALVFLVMFALRTSEWLLVANLAAATGLASLAMAGGHTWIGVVRGGFAVVTRLHRGGLWALRPLGGAAGAVDRATVHPLLRGGAIGFVLVVVFGVLFASSDRAFAQITEDLLVPEWDVGLIPARAVVAALTMSFVGAYALVAVERGRNHAASPWAKRAFPTGQPRPLHTLEWAIPLALLDLVFAAFVIVQITVLFGGRQHVLESAGLTYAEYARSGFFQLVIVAALVLGVIAVAVRVGSPGSKSARRLMQFLVGTLCVLTLVVLVSALRRLGLYEEAFGFTRLRFVVHLTIFWMSVVFLGVMVAGAMWRAQWLPRAVVAVTVLFLLGANSVNPDAFIADRNIERYRRTGKIDIAYVSSLSPDAVPVLARLPRELRMCVLDAYLQRLPTDETGMSYNLGRSRAAAVLREVAADSPPAPATAPGCPGQPRS